VKILLDSYLKIKYSNCSSYVEDDFILLLLLNFNKEDIDILFI